MHRTAVLLAPVLQASDALTEAVRAATEQGLPLRVILAATNHVSRCLISPSPTAASAAHPRPPGERPDPYRLKSGARLLTALMSLPAAQEPPGLRYNDLLAEFTRLSPKGSSGAAKGMLDAALTRALTDPEASCLSVISSPTEPQRRFLYVPPAPAPAIIPVPTPPPAPAEPPRPPTMAERLAALDAELD